MIADRTTLPDGVGFAFILAALSALAVIARFLPRSWLSKGAAPTPARETKRFRANVRRRTAPGTLSIYAGLSVILLNLNHSGAWNAASIGFTRRQPLAVSAFAGVVLYYLMLYGYGIVTRFLEQQETQQRSGLRVTFRNLPRTRVERCVVIGTICLINPVVEEVVFRGLLVHQFAILTGNLPRALVIGAIVNALNHAYQGFRSMPFHLLFYGATVTLMYSSYGLAAAIAMHYAADAVPLLGLKERLAAYRKVRRAKRRRATLLPPLP